MRDSTQKYITVGVLAAALLVTVTLAGGFVGSAAAQTGATVEETTVDADGSQITVRTGGSAAVEVADLPAGSSVGDVSDGGSYDADDGSISWLTLSDGLPETVTFTLTPPEGMDTVTFSLDDGSFEETVTLDVTEEQDDAFYDVTAELEEDETLPSSVTNGESISSEVIVTNTGNELAAGTVILSVVDETGSTVTQLDSNVLPDLEPNQPQTVPLSGNVEVPSAGDYTLVLSVNGINQVSQSLRVTGTDPAPAAFNITSTTTTSPVSAGETLTVSIGVTNTGGQQDTKNVAAGISGIETVDQAITLAPGERTIVDLSIQTTSGDAGEYPVVISAGEDTAYPSITINPSDEEQPDNDPSDEISDRQVALDGEVTVTLTPDNTDDTLAIQGETEGWTVVSTTPVGTAVNPVEGTILDPEGGENDIISTFESYDENGEFSVTLSPPSDASAGESYQFDVTETSDGEIVDSRSFNIDITSPNDGTADVQVPPGGEVTRTFTPEDTGNTLAIQGETAGWTVVDTNPEGITVNPVAGTVLDPEGGEDDTISTFGSYEDGEFSVTLSPPSDASVGESYQFDVTETRDGETVNSDSFTIGIGSGSSAPSWVGNSDITPSQYNAFDDGDGELTDSEVRNGIQTYVQSSLTGENQINGVEFTDSKIRELITGYVQSQL